MHREHPAGAFWRRTSPLNSGGRDAHAWAQAHQRYHTTASVPRCELTAWVRVVDTTDHSCHQTISFSSRLPRFAIGPHCLRTVQDTLWPWWRLLQRSSLCLLPWPCCTPHGSGGNHGWHKRKHSPWCRRRKWCKSSGSNQQWWLLRLWFPPGALRGITWIQCQGQNKLACSVSHLDPSPQFSSMVLLMLHTHVPSLSWVPPATNFDYSFEPAVLLQDREEVFMRQGRRFLR